MNANTCASYDKLWQETAPSARVEAGLEEWLMRIALSELASAEALRAADEIRQALYSDVAPRSMSTEASVVLLALAYACGESQRNGPLIATICTWLLSDRYGMPDSAYILGAWLAGIDSISPEGRYAGIEFLRGLLKDMPPRIPVSMFMLGETFLLVRCAQNVISGLPSATDKDRESMGSYLEEPPAKIACIAGLEMEEFPWKEIKDRLCEGRVMLDHVLQMLAQE
jgi:hypothetical protein